MSPKFDKMNERRINVKVAHETADTELGLTLELGLGNLKKNKFCGNHSFDGSNPV